MPSLQQEKNSCPGDAQQEGSALYLMTLHYMKGRSTENDREVNEVNKASEG